MRIDYLKMPRHKEITMQRDVEVKDERELKKKRECKSGEDDKIVTEFNGPRERAERRRLNQFK